MLARRILAWYLVVLICFAVSPWEAAANDQPEIQNRFESFCREWLQIVNDFASKKMQCRKSDQGYIAEYTGFSETLSVKVKNADPVKKTYVGILEYNEIKLQRQGLTPEAAKKGPFVVISQSPVKAIFMYRNGKWQN